MKPNQFYKMRWSIFLILVNRKSYIEDLLNLNNNVIQNLNFDFCVWAPLYCKYVKVTGRDSWTSHTILCSVITRWRHNCVILIILRYCDGNFIDSKLNSGKLPGLLKQTLSFTCVGNVLRHLLQTEDHDWRKLSTP